MRIARVTGTIGLLFLVLFACATGAHAQLRTGDVPPDPLGTNPAGADIHVSDYRGKVVVLTFWASWCPYCMKELPVLENLQRRVGASRIAVIGVNTDKDRGRYVGVRRRMKNFQLTLTADESGSGVANSYGVSGLPHMVMIDKAGRVAHVHVGYSEKMLAALVDEINALLDQPAPVAAVAVPAAATRVGAAQAPR